jgi:hypothetical protein
MIKYFVANVTREGLYEEGGKFKKVDGGNFYALLGDSFLYPHFTEEQLKISLDFKEVEELWMPSKDENFWEIDGVIFRTYADYKSAIDKSNALVKELSDKSRGKGGDDG